MSENKKKIEKLREYMKRENPSSSLMEYYKKGYLKAISDILEILN